MKILTKKYRLYAACNDFFFMQLSNSRDMNFYDSSDLDKGEVIYYPGDFLTDNAGIQYHFVPNNTSIVIEDGMIIEMYRSYIP